MLVELRIRDYAVVEDLTLRLGPGLNALTGETGAGKSIIVGALSLLLGERASSSVVRVGAARAMVEAVFEVEGPHALMGRLDELGFQLDDNLLILRREVAAEGRNRAWVNGSPATASVVGEIGTALVDLHGQHEHQTLLRPREQRSILDAYAGAHLLAHEVSKMYGESQRLVAALDDREQRRRDIESRADFLRFQLAEIADAKLSPSEDEELEAEAGRHEHAAELATGANAVHEMLYASDDSIADRLTSARRALERLASFDPELQARADTLADVVHLVNEIGRGMGDYATSVDHDPARLEHIRERLDRIFRLKRKYGPELADVLATGQRVSSELADLDDADHDLGELRSCLEEAEGALAAAAARLSELRSDAAGRLASAVAGTLPALGLEGSAFEVRLLPSERISAGGAENVEFRVSPNAGFEPMPLSRIASGGELSRVMLALKSILAEVDQVPVLVFDEIDAGVGGVVGSAVAEKLADVARTHQVLVVTHLPQVASRAASHLLVEKAQGRDVTSASVRELAGDSRVEEIARMLGGDPGSTVSRQHARELLAG